MTMTASGRFVVASLALLLLAGPCRDARAQAVGNPYDVTRTSSFTYATSGAQLGLLLTETVEPDQPEQCVVTTHSYDAYGNKAGAVVANCAGASGRALFAARSSSSTYAAQTVSVAGTSVAIPAGTFATSASNALAHTEARQYDPRFGVVTRLTGPNGLSTVQGVDDFGRVVSERRADGTSTETLHCLIQGRGLDTSSNSAGCGTTPPLSGRGDEIPAAAISYVQSQARDAAGAWMSAPARSYRDRAGRVVREITAVAMNVAPQPDNRRWVVKDTEYSATGVAVVKTQPYFLESGSSTLEGSNDYGLEVVTVDALGRPIRVDVADPQGNAGPSNQYGRTRRWASTTIGYDGLTITTVNAKGQTRREEKNVQSQVVRVTDAHGAQLALQHDAVGNLLQTKDALQNLVTITYDTRGRKLRQTDPDTGAWEYDYNAVGELVWQRSPNQRAAGTQTTMAYDRLGRMTERVTPEFTSRWYHDQDAAGAACGRGIGKLCESVTSHGVTRKQRYDTLGRPDWSRTLVSGGPSFETWAVYHPTTGRVSRQVYPTRLAVDYTYGSLGALLRVSLANAVTLNPLPATPGGAPAASQTWAAGRVLWSSGSVTAWGKPATAELGNGVQVRTGYDAATGRVVAASAGPGTARSAMDHAYGWDALNNLTSRIDALGDGGSGAVNESFGYDALNRLTSYVVAAPSIPGLQRSVTLTYNAIGNLLSKSDVGTYSYPPSGNSGGVTLPRPHAVSRVSGPTFGTVDYGYDANGNVVSATGGSSAVKWRSISYTSFNLPDSQNGIAGASGLPRSTWQYDENHQRIRETRVNAAGTRTTWYQHPDNRGGLAFESEVAPGGALSQRHYISAGAQTLVLVSTAPLPALDAVPAAAPTPPSLVLVKSEYWLKDHLGSIVATLDHAGAVTARYAYDPFGKRRYTNGNYDTFGALVIDWSSSVSHGTDRGFTGHEHLDDLGLVHMNGRLFDPTIARFLQGDPFIQAPEELQNYNRYSYCFNNGLNCVDPSGQIFKWLARIWRDEIWRTPIGRALVSIAVAYLVGPAGGADWLFGVGTKSLASSAIAGFASGAVATGTLEGGVRGAFSAMLFHTVGLSVGDAGVNGSTVHNAAEFARAIALHGVVGCVTSIAGGGKCGPGALSAALSKAAIPWTDSFGEGLERALAHAVVGGTASVIGGGKFANGAITGAFSYLFNALGSKVIKDLYDLKGSQYSGELRGHHKFDEALARKYDDYMSPEAINAASTDRIGQGYTNTGLPGDPHGWNDAHKAATGALSTQMDDWIASGRISKENPMTHRQYVDFMNEGQRVPAVGNFWKSITEFVDLMQSRGIQPKLRGMPRARGISE